MNKKVFFVFLSALLCFTSFLDFTPQKQIVRASSTSTWTSTSADLEDTYVSSQYPTTNYANSQYLVAGKHGTFLTTRSYLKFKLPTLPQGAVIQSAKVSLYQYFNTSNEATVDVRPVTSTWDSSSVNWNTKPTVGDSVSNQLINKPGWYDFYITNLASRWFTGTKNHGIAVQFRDETQATKIFYSNNHATYTTLRPKLTITYTLPEPPETEYRAFWVDMFHDGAKTPQQVDQLIQDVLESNANTIFLQVRRRGDAFYLNSIEPKTEDPFLQSGYDPLSDLIQKAHSANLQVHAWFAMMPIWNKTTPPKDPNHIFNVHGMTQPSEDNWLSQTYTGSYQYGSEYVIDPGHPDAVDFTRDVIMHVVKNYEVDGIQMDLVRYMGEEWGYNDVSVQRFNAVYNKTGLPGPTDPTWKQWRRDQVSNMVRKIYTSVQSVKPEVTVSAATIAWGDGPETLDDWNNSSTMNSALQDWRSWLEEGTIDLAVPMNYFREYDANQRIYYENWIEWQKNNQGKRMTLSGVGNYLNSISDSLTQVKKAKSSSLTGKTFGGISLYSYAVTNKDNVSNSEFYHALSKESTYSQQAVFPSKVGVPVFPWKASPTKGHLSGKTSGTNHQLVMISGPETREVYTDGSGDFFGIELIPGTYTVTSNGISQSVTIQAGQVSSITLNEGGEN
jgi:uncharacterized lipoprotein YddW (UPF0748 family)